MNKKTNMYVFMFLMILGTVQQLTSQSTAAKFEKVTELGGIEEYHYTPNGMNLLLLEDNSAPVVNVQIVYHVGSKHEVSGNTGSAHLLEHLMFKGTEKFNKRKGTSIDNKLNNIGARMNATTWNDRTNYYETIPSDKIDIALEIEADRMRNSLLLEEDKDSEMTVVRNEFERSENNPNSVLSKEMWAAAYMAHPYHHSTIGWRSDIEKMPIEVLRKFYNTYYWPDNATLTIIGDFNKNNLFTLVDKHFGKISKAPHTIPQPYTEEPSQFGPRKVVVKKPGQAGLVSIAYKIPGRLHQDLPALRVLGQIVGSGTSSLINTEFIDQGLAFYGYAGPSSFKEVGLFFITLGIAPESDFEEINKKMLGALEKIKSNGVQQADVDRIVAKLNAQSILARDGFGNIASQLNEAIAGGDWKDYIKRTERLSAVTAADVQVVAQKYLIEDQSTTGHFIPKTQGSNPLEKQKAGKFLPHEEDKIYYRHPGYGRNSEKTKDKLHTASGLVKTAAEAYHTPEYPKKEERFQRKTMAGIDVVTANTGVKDFVTIVASFPIGNYFNANVNKSIPSLTVELLSKGTMKKDKFEFSQELERLGVSINIHASTHKVDIGFKCLKKDLDKVVDLLAEELRYPRFDANELEVLKQQTIGGMQQRLSNPGSMGRIALSQIIYPEKHPNYLKNINSSIEDIRKSTLDEIKEFHKAYFGPAGMHLVAVGDVDTAMLYKALEKSFADWKGGIKKGFEYDRPKKAKAQTEVITIPQKPSAELFIGQYTGLTRTDADYIPFFIGNYILGGGFSGRLMRTVRDEEGLTYDIGTQHQGHSFGVGGNWILNASFNPQLLQTGLDATMAQLKKWRENGITKKELRDKKSNLIGSFKVGMSSTVGMATTLLDFLERGLPPYYIDQYPKDITAVTLYQVNRTIKKYINLDKLVIVKSGSLNENGEPLAKQ